MVRLNYYTKNLFPSLRGRRAPVPRKETRRKEISEMCEEKYIEAQSAKPSTPTQVIDELIGNEEQNGTQKKE